MQCVPLDTTLKLWRRASFLNDSLSFRSIAARRVTPADGYPAAGDRPGASDAAGCPGRRSRRGPSRGEGEAGHGPGAPIRLMHPMRLGGVRCAGERPGHWYYHTEENSILA